MAKLLLVEPEFPIPKKSRDHAKFLPLPLPKLARKTGFEMCLYPVESGR